MDTACSPNWAPLRDGKPATTSSSAYALTPKGRLMARLPLDPRLSCMILEADQRGCLEELAVIAAALSIQGPA